MLWHILQTFGSKVSKCIQKQTPTQFSAMSPLGWPYRGTLECPQGTYPNREQSRCSYCNRFGPYGDVEKTTATTGERVGLVLKSQVLYGYYYDEQFDVFSHKSSLWNSKTRVYFINFSAWRKKYVYIYIPIVSRKLLVPKSQYQRCQGMWREILTANALYVFLPCVTPKQVSDWPLLLQCRGFGNKEFFQKIVAKKSWRALLLLVRWFGEQGFIHPIPSYWGADAATRWVPFDPRHLVKR